MSAGHVAPQVTCTRVDFLDPIPAFLCWTHARMQWPGSSAEAEWHASATGSQRSCDIKPRAAQTGVPGRPFEREPRLPAAALRQGGWHAGARGAGRPRARRGRRRGALGGMLPSWRRKSAFEFPIRSGRRCYNLA